jgi:hypothetical protein
LAEIGNCAALERGPCRECVRAHSEESSVAAMCGDSRRVDCRAWAAASVEDSTGAVDSMAVAVDSMEVVAGSTAAVGGSTVAEGAEDSRRLNTNCC